MKQMTPEEIGRAWKDAAEAMEQFAHALWALKGLRIRYHD